MVSIYWRTGNTFSFTAVHWCSLAINSLFFAFGIQCAKYWVFFCFLCFQRTFGVLESWCMWRFLWISRLTLWSLGNKVISASKMLNNWLFSICKIIHLHCHTWSETGHIKKKIKCWNCEIGELLQIPRRTICIRERVSYNFSQQFIISHLTKGKKGLALHSKEYTCFFKTYFVTRLPKGEFWLSLLYIVYYIIYYTIYSVIQYIV